VTLEPARTIADGIAVRRVGDLTYALAARLVDEMVVCDDEETSHAILQLLEREKLVAEGAGAIALAAALHGKVDLKGRSAVALVCGGNIDVTLVSRIIERGLVKDGRLVRLAVTVPDRPGELARLTGVVARARANVVEIHHNRAFSQGRLGETLIELVLETRGHAHIDELVAALEAEGSVVRRG
jgi:threonine dehydratase